MMLLNWMMKDDYTKFKERAGQSGEQRYWTYESAQEGGEPR